jgi:hypothetical protein
MAIKYPEDHKVFGGIAVIVMIANNSSLKVSYSEEETFSPWWREQTWGQLSEGAEVAAAGRHHYRKWCYLQFSHPEKQHRSCLTE